MQPFLWRLLFDKTLQDTLKSIIVIIKANFHLFTIGYHDDRIQNLDPEAEHSSHVIVKQVFKTTRFFLEDKKRSQLNLIIDLDQGYCLLDGLL